MLAFQSEYEASNGILNRQRSSPPSNSTPHGQQRGANGSARVDGTPAQTDGNDTWVRIREKLGSRPDDASPLRSARTSPMRSKQQSRDISPTNSARGTEVSRERKSFRICTQHVSCAPFSPLLARKSIADLEDIWVCMVSFTWQSIRHTEATSATENATYGSGRDLTSAQVV